MTVNNAQQTNYRAKVNNQIQQKTKKTVNMYRDILAPPTNAQNKTIIIIIKLALVTHEVRYGRLSLLSSTCS